MAQCCAGLPHAVIGLQRKRELLREPFRRRLNPRIHLHRQRLRITAAADGEAGRWRELASTEETDPRVLYFERFVDCVRKGSPPEVGLAAGVAVQEVVEAAYRSVEDGRPVRIEELR